MTTERRASAALFFLRLPEDERVDIGPRVVLAPLTAREAERIRSKLGEHLPIPLARIEYFGVPAEAEADHAVALHTRTMGLLAIATMRLPLWSVVVVDELQDVWTRVAYSWNTPPAGLPFQSRSRDFGVVEHFFPGWRAGTASIPTDRHWPVSAADLQRFRQLVENWPTAATGRLDLAVRYFYDAAQQLLSDETHAFLSMSISLEALLGEGGSELSYRVSLRGSHLVGGAEGKEEIFERLRKAYDARSRLVHRGEQPPPAEVAWLLAYLRVAIPRFAALTIPSQSHDAALQRLSAQSLSGQDEVVRLNDPEGWWNLPVSLLDA